MARRSVVSAWSDEKKANVRKLFADGYSSLKLAKIFKCSNKTIMKLCSDIPFDGHQRQAAGLLAYHRQKFHVSGRNIVNALRNFDEIDNA